MNTGGISATIIGLSTTFSPWLILAIFAITLVAQFGFFIPYLLESLWLFSGYSAITGIFSPYFLLVLCVTGILGRELGSGLFFYISSMGGSPLQRFYRRHIGPKLAAAAARKAGQAKLSLGTHILARIYSFSGDAGAGQEVQLFGNSGRGGAREPHHDVALSAGGHGADIRHGLRCAPRGTPVGQAAGLVPGAKKNQRHRLAYPYR